MNEQERIRLMTRLCLLEKEHGKEIWRAERTFRSDYLAASVLRALAFGLAAWMCTMTVVVIRHAQDLYHAAMDGQIKLLIAFAGGSLGLFLILCGIAAFIYSRKRWAKAAAIMDERAKLIELLDQAGTVGIGTEEGKRVTE